MSLTAVRCCPLHGRNVRALVDDRLSEMKNAFPCFLVLGVFFDILGIERIDSFRFDWIDRLHFRMCRCSPGLGIRRLTFLSRSPSSKQQRRVGMRCVFEYCGSVDRAETFTE